MSTWGFKVNKAKFGEMGGDETFLTRNYGL